MVTFGLLEPRKQAHHSCLGEIIQFIRLFFLFLVLAGKPCMNKFFQKNNLASKVYLACSV